MRAYLILAAATLACLHPDAGAAQEPTRSAVARLTADLALPDELRRGLEASLVSTFAGDGLRYDPAARAYTLMECENTEMRARLVDLNGDATPEVEVQGGGTCIGGMAGGLNWIFIRAPSTGDWRVNLDFPGGVVPLGTRSAGYLDVMAVGPGFCHGVWRWNGREYAHLCNAGEGTTRCDMPCPRTVDARMTGDELPPFTAGASPRRP
ncbi:MAG TPA: hypothetical protein VFQ39_02380 [Longimicrobium sp.]|nr:hypothetical protein [Longimicrobium sp.]